MSDDRREDKILERIEQRLQDIASNEKTNLTLIELDLNLIAGSLADLVNILRPHRAVVAHLTYSIGGNTMGASVNGVVGNTATPHFTEAAADGSNVAPIGPVIYASDNPSVVSVDASTGIATLAAAGTANVSALDQGNGLTDSVAFSVSAAPPPVAVSASLSYTLNPSRR